MYIFVSLDVVFWLFLSVWTDLNKLEIQPKQNMIAAFTKLNKLYRYANRDTLE